MARRTHQTTKSRGSRLLRPWKGVGEVLEGKYLLTGASIDIDKTVVELNGSTSLHSNIQVGDELTYSFQVTNDGDTRLSDVKLDDPLPGLSVSGSVSGDFVAYRQPLLVPTVANSQIGPYAALDRTLASDPFEAKAWDNFTLSSAQTIDRISWDGAYVEPFATGVGSMRPEADFVVEIFDGGATPGARLHSFTLAGGSAGVNDGVVATSFLPHKAALGGPAFHYDAPLPATAMPAGSYWISITAEQTFPSVSPLFDPTWQWHVGELPDGGHDGFYYFDDTFDDPGDGGSGYVDSTPRPSQADDKDLSFALYSSETNGFDGTLQPGQSVTFRGTYTVTTADVANGLVANTASASAASSGGSVSAQDSVNVTIATPSNPSITLDKHLWDVDGDADVSVAQVGDQLIYGLFVTNDGNTPLTNVQVTDPLPGLWIDGDVFRSFDGYSQTALIPAEGEFGAFSATDREMGSDPFEAKAWDNFSLTDATLLDGISWDGLYVEPFASGPDAAAPKTDFVIEFYSDANGQPDALLEDYWLSAGLAGQSDGDVLSTLLGHQSPEGGNAYHYDAGFPLLELPAGDYWVSIHARQTFPSPAPLIDPTWQWHLGANADGSDGFYHYDDTFDDPGDNGIGLTDRTPKPSNANFEAGKDMAFTLSEARLVGYDANAALAPGETMIFVGYYDVTVADAVAGQIDNHATATGEASGGEVVSAEDGEWVTVANPQPDIELNKYLWDINGSPMLHSNIVAGDELIYSFDVTNTGDTQLSNVSVSDPLPGIVFDTQVVNPFTAYEQSRLVPADSNLGLFSSTERTLANDPYEAKAWDNFSLGAEVVIDGISWDGACIEPFAGGGVATPETDFLVEIYSDGSGTPGSVLHSFTLNGGDAGVSDALVTTTLLEHTALEGGPAYHYQGMLPFTTMPAGDYWLSITAQQTFPNVGPTVDPTWQWHVGTKSGGADGFYFYDDTFDDAGDGGAGLVNSTARPHNFESDKDLSFKLHGAELVDFNGTLATGQSVMFMATYIVTDADVAAGQIVNKATVTADSSQGGGSVMAMDTETVKIDAPANPDASIDLEKRLWDADGENDYSTVYVGDELEFGFFVTNTGDAPLTDVTIDDPFPGLTMDSEVYRSREAYGQHAYEPSDGNLGPFAGWDRTIGTDPLETKAWDNFTLLHDILLDGISWDGAYAEPFATGAGAATPETDFVIEIFDDASGLPGSMVDNFWLSAGEAGVSDGDVRSTRLGHTSTGGGAAYHYDASLPIAELAAGEYWISITSRQTFPSASPLIDPTWQWHVGNASGGDGFYFYDDQFDDEGDNGQGLIDRTPRVSVANFETGKDLAFQLSEAKRVAYDANEVLAAGESMIFVGRYTVTAADGERTMIDNHATVYGDTSFNTTVSAEDGEWVWISQRNGAIDLDKFLWDINGSPSLHHDLVVGDELIYSFNVTNTGDETLSNVTVHDPLPGLTMDEQVAQTYVAHDQKPVAATSGNLGVYASVDRSLGSDPFEAKAWDNFTFETDTVIDAISWVGAYDSAFDGPLVPETDFLVEFFSDDAGKPGSSVLTFEMHGGQAGVDDVNVSTMLLGHRGPNDGPVYHYDGMIPFTLLEAGEYWVSITAQQTFPNTAPTIDPTWQWHLGSKSDGADGFYFYDDTFDEAGDQSIGLVDGTPTPKNFDANKDLAFTVHASKLIDFDGTLESGQAVMFMGTYYVTQADINAGQIVNSATVTAHLPNGSALSDSDSFSFAANQSASLQISAVEAPAAAQSSSGNAVTMDYEVISTGNVTLFEVAVDNIGGDDDPILVVASDDGRDGVLSPGETWRFVGDGRDGMETKASATTVGGTMVYDALVHDVCVPNVGDIDGDGFVGFADFLMLSNNFGASDADLSNGDLNCDGAVGFADFLLLADNFGYAAASTADSIAPPLATDAAFAALTDSDTDEEDWLI